MPTGDGVTFVLYTRSVDAVTALDIELADRIDAAITAVGSGGRPGDRRLLVPTACVERGQAAGWSRSSRMSCGSWSSAASSCPGETWSRTTAVTAGTSRGTSSAATFASWTKRFT